jgi:hypothetical protein
MSAEGWVWFVAWVVAIAAALAWRAEARFWEYQAEKFKRMWEKEAAIRHNQKRKGHLE